MMTSIMPDDTLAHFDRNMPNFNYMPINMTEICPILSNRSPNVVTNVCKSSALPTQYSLLSEAQTTTLTDKKLILAAMLLKQSVNLATSCSISMKYGSH